MGKISDPEREGLRPRGGGQRPKEKGEIHIERHGETDLEKRNRIPRVVGTGRRTVRDNGER